MFAVSVHWDLGIICNHSKSGLIYILSSIFLKSFMLNFKVLSHFPLKRVGRKGRRNGFGPATWPTASPWRTCNTLPITFFPLPLLLSAVIFPSRPPQNPGNQLGLKSDQQQYVEIYYYIKIHEFIIKLKKRKAKNKLIRHHSDSIGTNWQAYWKWMGKVKCLNISTWTKWAVFSKTNILVVEGKFSLQKDSR